MKKPLYKIDLRKFRTNYDMSDLYMLEYLEDYIPDDLINLYHDVLNYNEIYANSWTINDLFEMGKENEYWINCANSFIKKYNIEKKDYDNFDKYFGKYVKLRDELINELGLSQYIDSELSRDDIPSGGIISRDMIINPQKMNDIDSYIILRIMNYGNSVELHYSNGKATIEYGYKISHNYWKTEIEDIDWFNKKMDKEEISKKLFEIFKSHFDIEYNNLIYEENMKKKMKDDYKEILGKNDKSIYYMKKGAFKTFYINNDKFTKVPQDILDKYIDNYLDNKELPVNESKIYSNKIGGGYLAVDNSTGECYVEEFDTEKEVYKWLLEKKQKCLEEKNTDYEIC